MDRTIIGLILLTALIFGGVLLYAKQSGTVTSPVSELQGEEIAQLGREHIPEGEAYSQYNSNPPTSGPHWPMPANWGSYTDEQADERLVHNLEHGGVNIFYQPTTTNDVELKILQQIAGRYRSKVVMAPRSKNEKKIALTSWGRLYTSEVIEESLIVSFIDHNRNHGPEFVP